jgi:hypothetical protein
MVYTIRNEIRVREVTHMNTVNTKLVPPITSKTTVGELIGSNMRSHGQTAFVGSIGGEEGLFLITYGAVVKANQPNLTWNYSGNRRGVVHVDRYCDVVITEE